MKYISNSKYKLATRQFIVWMLLVVVFFSFRNYLSAQQQVTNINSDGANSAFFMEEIDGVKYIGEIKSNDVVEVSVLEDDFTHSLIHSQKFKGIFQGYYQQIQGSTLFTFDDATPVMYDFVKDEITYVNIPAAVFGSWWRLTSEEYGVVACVNPALGTNPEFLVNRNGEILENAENYLSIRGIVGDAIFVSLEINEDNKIVYGLEFLETGVIDTLFSGSNVPVYMYEEDLFYYQNDQGSIIQLDLLTGVKKAIPNVVFPPNEVMSIGILEDKLAIAHRAGLGDHITYIFDLQSGEELYSFYEDSLFDFPLGSSFIAQNKFVILHFGKLYIFDMTTGDVDIHVSAYWFTLPQLIEGRYIFNSDLEETSFIDLQTGENIMVDNPDKVHMGSYAKVIDMGGSYLGIFDSFNVENKSVFKIDIDDFTVEHLDEIDNTNSGIISDMDLLKFADNLVLATDDIYKIEDGEEVKINPCELESVLGETYKIEEDRILCLCKDEAGERIIYSYDGEELSQEGILPNINTSPDDDFYFNDYRVTSDYVVYLISSFPEHRLYLYNKQTGSTTLLKTYDSYYISRPLYQDDDVIYYNELNTLYRIGKEGDLSKVLDHNVEFGAAGLILQLKDYVYYHNDDSLSILTENGLQTLLTGDFTSAYFLFSPEQSLSTSAMLISRDVNGELLLIYINDEEAYQVGIDNLFKEVIKIKNDHFLIETQDPATNEKWNYIFDGNTKQVFEITDFVSSDREIIDMIFREGEPHLVSKNDEINKIYLTKLDENYSNPVEVYSTDVFGGFSRVSYFDSGDYGVINLIEEIGVLGDDFPVKTFDLKGNGKNPEMHEIGDGHVYFIANDAESGNQVFRVKPTEFYLGTEVEEVLISIHLFPNPTNSYITIGGDYSNQSYQIFNIQGKLKHEGILNSSIIDVQNLNSGSYLIKIKSNSQIHMGKFVKL